jgi:hypothetical protein
MAARTKAWSVFANLNISVVGLNPTRGMEVSGRSFCVYVMLCVCRDLATGWSPAKGVLRIVYKVKELKKPSKLSNGR